MERRHHRLLVAVAAALAVLGSVVLSASSLAARTPTPRTGDYYGEAHGVSAELQVVRVKGRLQVRYVAIGGSGGDLFQSPAPSSCPLLTTLGPSRFGARLKGNAFVFAGVHGHFDRSDHATGTFTELGLHCKAHWSVHRVQRHSVRDGAWSASSSIGPLTLTVSAGGRAAQGQFSGVFGSVPNHTCSGVPFDALIRPDGRIAGSSDLNAGGQHTGAVYDGRFTSSTKAHGSLQGKFDCAGPVISWSARR